MGDVEDGTPLGATDFEQDTETPIDDKSPENVRAEEHNLMDAFEKQDELQLDDKERRLIHHLLHESEDTSYGIGACEVYVLMSPRMVPVGWWIDADILSKVPPAQRDLVSKPKVAVQNVDLVGNLGTSKFHTTNGTKKEADAQRKEKKKASSKKGLHWLELSSVINDPDQSSSKRTEAMRDAGLDIATGIKFNVFGIHGMVVYYAEAGIDLKVLKDPANETYLVRLAYMKGTILSVIEARRDAMEVQQDAQAELVQNDTGLTSVTTPTAVAQHIRSDFRGHKFRDFVLGWLRKTVGGGAQIPPCFTYVESIWTMVGTFVGLLLIAALNRTFRLVSEEEHFLVLGPFGALMMLQYGLTGAPAGQPRNVIVGHAIAGSISLGLTYVPEEHFPVYMRQIISVTIANGIMVKLGVPCPPASAHSLIYAEGKHDWTFFGLAMLGCLLSFVPAIFLNNLNPNRQYPIYWGYAPRAVYNHIKKETQKDTQKVKQGTQEGVSVMKHETQAGAGVVKQGTQVGADVVKQGTQEGANVVKHGTQDGVGVAKLGTEAGADVVKLGTEAGADVVKLGTQEGANVVKQGTEAGENVVKHVVPV